MKSETTFCVFFSVLGAFTGEVVVDKFLKQPMVSSFPSLRRLLAKLSSVRSSSMILRCRLSTSGTGGLSL